MGRPPSLPCNKVREMRREVLSGRLRQARAAEIYNISQPQVSRIVSGQQYKYC